MAKRLTQDELMTRQLLRFAREMRLAADNSKHAGHLSNAQAYSDLAELLDYISRHMGEIAYQQELAF